MLIWFLNSICNCNGVSNGVTPPYKYVALPHLYNIHCVCLICVYLILFILLCDGCLFESLTCYFEVTFFFLFNSNLGAATLLAFEAISVCLFHSRTIAWQTLSAMKGTIVEDALSRAMISLRMQLDSPSFNYSSQLISHWKHLFHK